MKSFYYELGHLWAKTMTVAELRAKLSEYPDDMAVFAEWEGTRNAIRADSFDIGQTNRPTESCLLIDVDNRY